MAKILLFNKPYGVLSQFSDSAGRATLARFIPVAHVYPAGRLDVDSEGLLLLTDDGRLQQHVTHPRHKLPKTYWAQVEGSVQHAALAGLRSGVALRDGTTLPAEVRTIPEPDLWPRRPPIRYRKSVPTTWIELTLVEGRNRQVRRMTAAVGHPTLRLVRWRVGPWTLADIAPGEWRMVGGQSTDMLEWRDDMDPPRDGGGRRGARRTFSHRRGGHRRSSGAEPAGGTPRGR